MNEQRRPVMVLAALAIVVLVSPFRARAWDEEAHSIVTDAAVARLSDRVPAFVRSSPAAARLRYLASEPDRWRNLRLPPMGQVNKPDHFFDVDLLGLYDLTPDTLPRYRYDFISHVAVYKAAHPDKDYGYDAARDPEHWKEWPGLAPYRICELYVQLRSSWRTYNTYSKYRDLAQPGELEACRDNIVYLMGVMSHHVADVAQPLHTTKHYDGWVGPNPKGYVTRRGYIHRQIDTAVARAAGLTAEALPGDLPQVLIDDNRLFEQVMTYILESHSHFEQVYVLEKKGALTPGSPGFAEGVDFVKRRLARASAMLAALWESAHREAGIDEYRERVFQTRLRRSQGDATSETHQRPSSKARPLAAAKVWHRFVTCAPGTGWKPAPH